MSSFKKEEQCGLEVSASERLELEARDLGLEQGSPRAWRCAVLAAGHVSLAMRDSPAGEGNELGQEEENVKKKTSVSPPVAAVESSLENWAGSCQLWLPSCFQTQTLVMPAPR